MAEDNAIRENFTVRLLRLSTGEPEARARPGADRQCEVGLVHGREQALSAEICDLLLGREFSVVGWQGSSAVAPRG
jgi:hypothetical protein